MRVRDAAVERPADDFPEVLHLGPQCACSGQLAGNVCIFVRGGKVVGCTSARTAGGGSDAGEGKCILQTGIDRAREPKHKAQIAEGEGGNLEMRGGSSASGESWVDDEGCREREVLGWREEGGREGGGTAGQEGYDEVECLRV